MPVVQVNSTVVISGITLELNQADARILRMFLGGTRRDERREAVRRNGGDSAEQDRARYLVKEIIDAIDAQAPGLFVRGAAQSEPESVDVDMSDDTDEEDSF